MTTPQACLFSSSIGACGIAWSERGVCAVQLPEASEAATARRLLRRSGARSLAEPPVAIAALVVRLQRHIAGSPDALADAPLDLDGLSPFARAIYATARGIPPGRTTTYADLARLAGRPGATRAVGRAMAGNPLPLLVPCHRVLAADGSLGGFSAWGEGRTKLRLLTIEGADLGMIAESGVRRLRRVDPALAKVIRRVGPYRLPGDQRSDPFTALGEAIVHQQVSMKAGATIFRRVLDAAGTAGVLDPRQLLAAPAATLRAAGLSRQKASYLVDLARKSTSGALPLDRLARLDDEQVIEALVQVKGIGRWSAEMFMMFRLGRLDVLPVDDLGLRKGAQQVYRMRQLPNAARLRRLAAPWVPFRSIATWYLWRSLESGGM